MPSVSIVVARGDETLVEHAWGLADVASGRKAEPSTIYQVGSLSKPAAPVVTIENTPSAAAPVGAGKFVGEYEAVPGVLFTVTLENGILFNTPPARTGNPKQYLVPSAR